jgi:hypothetical protein
MAEQPDLVWANCVNFSGLLSYLPIPCVKKDNKWFDESGEFEVEKLGLVVKNKNITYASRNINEVESWTVGVLAVLKLISRGKREIQEQKTTCNQEAKQEDSKGTKNL